MTVYSRQATVNVSMCQTNISQSVTREHKDTSTVCHPVCVCVPFFCFRCGCILLLYQQDPCYPGGSAQSQLLLGPSTGQIHTNIINTVNACIYIQICWPHCALCKLNNNHLNNETTIPQTLFNLKLQDLTGQTVVLRLNGDNTTLHTTSVRETSSVFI